MLKKLVALASLTALTGLGTAIMVVGCTTDTTTEDTTDSGTTDSGTTKRDGSAVAPQDAGPAVCPSPAPTDDPPYKPANAHKDACDPGIGDYINNYINSNQNATFKDLENNIAANSSMGGSACSTCIFTQENDAGWGPIVYAADGSGGAFFNYGSCFEKAPGGSAACGKAVQQAEFCLDQVCNDTDCGSDQAKQSCVQEALSDTSGCGRYDVQAGCGSALQSLNTACKTGLDVIKVMCAKPGANDGG